MTHVVSERSERGSVLASATPETYVLLSLAQVEPTVSTLARVSTRLENPLDWNEIGLQSLQHKVVHLVWSNLRRAGLIKQAIRTGGLTKLWALYFNQLTWLNEQRNKLFLQNTERLLQTLSGAGLDIVCLKGGALIGSVYPLDSRMMQDIDLIGRRRDLPVITAVMRDLGYTHGVYDDASGQLLPLEERVARFWAFHNHNLPTFYRPSDNWACPFYKVSIGFDLFDAGDGHGYHADEMLTRSQLKSPESSIRVPGPFDMLMSLCAHIYREGSSDAYADYGENFHLIKFCDLRTHLQSLNWDRDAAVFGAAIRRCNMIAPYYYAVYYTDMVYGDAFLKPWLEVAVPDDLTYLDELVDGPKRRLCEHTFYDRLFRVRTAASTHAVFNTVIERDAW
jgi:hypothetical protein